jgi:membrane-associated phospholipid phosphatase
MNATIEKTEETAQRRTIDPSMWSSVLGILSGLSLALVLGYVYLELAADVRAGQAFPLDRSIMDALQRLLSPRLTPAVRLITYSASVLGTIVLALGLCIHWWRQAGRRPEASTLAVTLAGSAALGQALKRIFARPRPHVYPWLTAAGGWSFPSGHTLNAVVLAGLLAWLVGRRLNGWRRAIFCGIVVLWAVLVGLSRVYLGVHYPSDVLASLAVVGLCLLAAWGTHRAIRAVKVYRGA